jgi:hypothetical protein
MFWNLAVITKGGEILLSVCPCHWYTDSSSSGSCSSRNVLEETLNAVWWFEGQFEGPQWSFEGGIKVLWA